MSNFFDLRKMTKNKFVKEMKKDKSYNDCFSTKGLKNIYDYLRCAEGIEGYEDEMITSPWLINDRFVEYKNLKDYNLDNLTNIKTYWQLQDMINQGYFNSLFVRKDAS